MRMTPLTVFAYRRMDDPRLRGNIHFRVIPRETLQNGKRVGDRYALINEHCLVTSLHRLRGRRVSGKNERHCQCRRYRRRGRHGLRWSRYGALLQGVQQLTCQVLTTGRKQNTWSNFFKIIGNRALRRALCRFFSVCQRASCCLFAASLPSKSARRTAARLV